MDGHDPTPLPRDDAEANVERSESGALNTSARALVVGAALGTPDALGGIEEDVGALGFEAVPDRWGDWADRQNLHDASNVVLRGYGLIDEIRRREAVPFAAAGAPELLPQRADIWPAVARGDRAACVAWLRMLMTDDEPVAAASAATALADWHFDEDSLIPPAFQSARQISLVMASESPSSLAREISVAAIGERPGTDLLDPAEDTRTLLPSTEQPPRQGSVSLLVHGTGAWAGDWWSLGGDFHTFIRNGVRPDLYAGGSPFEWSGKYNDKHRRIAAARLARWAQWTAGGALHTVLAHSYGGIIALHATTHGLKIKELILLSVPVEKVDIEWANIASTASLRIHLDLVLLAARRRQAFNLPVAEHFLPRWFRNHADSHGVDVWNEYGAAGALGLTTSSV
ncbi:MAG: hypothetical protein M3Y44_04975 [Actinomycetota bacterium]|nr:hypothetical protein [Actinomycetota bacterium]